MSKFLRGKKTALKNFTENFTKVPNLILHAQGITAIDKLILIELQSYSTRPEYVLAYTRLANDLHIDKSNLIKRWKVLEAKGYIYVSKNDRWSINYDLLSQVVSDHLKSQVVLNHHTTEVGSSMPPSSGSLRPPTKVVSDHLNGSLTLPTEEYNKEEDKEIKNKEIKNKEEDKAKIEKDMITKDIVLTEIKERGLKVQSNNGIVTIYQSIPEYGTQFKKGDYDSMLKYVLDYPSIKIKQKDSSIDNDSKPVGLTSSINGSNTSPVEKEAYKEANSVSSIDEFISTLSIERVNKYASMERSELYQLLSKKIDNDSINIFDLIVEIKKCSSIERKTIQSSALDFEDVQSNESLSMNEGVTNVTHQLIDLDTRPANGGESSAPLLNEKIMEKVAYVVKDLIDGDYIKGNKTIPTGELVKGLNEHSTEKEIRRHIYTMYNN